MSVEKKVLGLPSRQVLEAIAGETLDDDFVDIDGAALFESTKDPTETIIVLFRDPEMDSLKTELESIDMGQDWVISAVASSTAWDKIMTGEIPVPEGWSEKPIQVLERELREEHEKA